MKATELRIGNLVQDKQGNIKTISGDSLAEIDGFDDRLLIEPIQLTEEWLLKFGFDEWEKDNWKLRNSLNKGGWSKQFNYYLPYYNLSTYTGNIIVQYVHQLQNLYFALTGNELTL